MEISRRNLIVAAAAGGAVSGAATGCFAHGTGHNDVCRNKAEQQ